ncbi:hypothetical protein MRS76_20790 [Rhizobiaceae bacterium n13]|uniref:HAD family hydrolase n=1 Tax=Ferirhizobium litorale TaxID=2927786 RepID=A0AAE3QF76_9HYPH|nr:hypothetical protein [Fererhizobium litorale]MDI7864379.1 hypothetical protein [Fererhizobium litorale]MDI7924707.1 hypothetical protein [Fererhizobium litorale]
MAGTPELAHIRLGDRPLVVCDIDEVVLEFISPFQAYLRNRQFELLPRSFMLHGNIFSLLDGSEPDEAAMKAMQEDFFANQDKWQKPAVRAVETLRDLSGDADVVFLTAMPPRYQKVRRTLLDRLDLPYPMIATEEAKGPVVEALHQRRPLPVAFLDDIQRNLQSVRSHVPDCLLVSLMANADFRALAPAPTEGIVQAADWSEANKLIRNHFLGQVVQR